MSASMTNELRPITESQLHDKATPNAAQQVEFAHKLLQELQVHQIELETQNKALRHYTELFDFAPIGYFKFEPSSKIMQVNLQGASLLELERANLTGRFFLNYVTNQHRETFRNFLAKTFETGDKQNCEVLVNVGQHDLWFSLEANTGATASNCLVAVADVTQRKQAEEKWERMAHYDLLTNLPNRVLLADRLSQAMVQCQRCNRLLAVAFMDLDGFKTINDTYGHDVGDELLITVSQRMKESLRAGDTLARIGGDEFIAVIADLERMKDSEPVLERLLEAAAEPVTVGGAVMQVSVSIGVTFYSQGGVDADQLMRYADQAMYTAKQAGKDCYSSNGLLATWAQ